MVIYEVNLDIQRHIVREYQKWLEKHVSVMLSFEGFEKAYILERKDESDTETFCLTTHYHITSMQNLQDYLDHHAEKMRADGIRHFGDLFKAHRRVLDVQKQYE